MKKAVAVVCLVISFLLMFCGCRMIRIEDEERKPVDYSVLNQQEIPKEVQNLIEEKKEREFQMSFQIGEELYLIRGYGRQMSRGYSIRVEELSESSNGLFFQTRLLGPPDDSLEGEPSYPCIVVRLEYREKPVIFE